MLPNGIDIWGATLFDFYSCNRFPDIGALVVYTSGSRLAGWMKRNGELLAVDQLGQAEREADPAEILPWPVAEAFKDVDNRAIMFSKTIGSAKTVEFGVGEPFQELVLYPRLQERIPFRLLPKTLIVHDRYACLSAGRDEFQDAEEKWDEKPDVVSVYRLQLSEEGMKKVAAENEAIEVKKRKDEAELAAFLANPTAENRPLGRGVLCVPPGLKHGPCPPATFFLHEAAPVREPFEEAHLYLSPNHIAGQGNHSFAFNAHWEIPRNMVVDDIICKSCVVQTGMAMVIEEDGWNGETKSPKWKDLSGHIIEKIEVFGGVSASIYTQRGEDKLDENGEAVTYDIEPPSEKHTRKYQGPVRVVRTGVKYQNREDGPLCEHLRKSREQWASLTGRVSVVAKLSYQYDSHLEKEAKNYQEFPTHFFQHWSGYNLMRPLHQPFPVGALVPQFYGYYVPDEEIPPKDFYRKDGPLAAPGDAEREESGSSSVENRYRSPILLIEDCGTPVCATVDEMNIDDRQEIATLFFRLHQAGWCHNSAYTRNVLRQLGPINDFPLARMCNAHNRSDMRQTSFRLIDFGRSEKDKDGSGIIYEEGKVCKTFRVGMYDNRPPGWSSD
ncbi:hypothetical protein DFP72DRAFT_821473 [Ephemerocybe angulata]|uniref:Uncharacterized protein n=1 Tax=Ephemerocybe angulata TaxID=980116 RepID=A0A8H6HJ36_9AGAR|nr:hypothetical protein DFP72DRAFT_821473 [Tulosesus angulatus]